MPFPRTRGRPSRRREYTLCNMKGLFLALVPLLAFAIVPAAAQDLTITNARIIGPNGTVIERLSIVVRGGRIASVGAGAASAAAGKTIDAKGMTAMPGFIDAHRHINTGPNEKAQIQTASRGPLRLSAPTFSREFRSDRKSGTRL